MVKKKLKIFSLREKKRKIFLQNHESVEYKENSLQYNLDLRVGFGNMWMIVYFIEHTRLFLLRTMVLTLKFMETKILVHEIAPQFSKIMDKLVNRVFIHQNFTNSDVRF